MIINKFETLYPRKLWVVIVDNKVNLQTDVEKLCKQFQYNESNKPFDVAIVNQVWRIIDEIVGSDIIAAVYATTKLPSGDLGVTCMIYKPDEVDASVIAHESVHLADYFCEACGLNSEDFSEGNETYAYLVGWCAGCIRDSMKKWAISHDDAEWGKV